jgi:hypothetical protein
MAQAIPMIIMAAPALLEGIGQMGQLNAAAKADRKNAGLAELDAAYSQEDIRRRGRATQGEAIASLAEGGSLEGGSAQDLIYQNSLEIEYAALGARYKGDLEAHNYRVKAGQEKQSAKMALLGGVLRAGAAAVTGASNARNQSAQEAALARQRSAYFPGGQALPMPTPPSYTPQYRAGP